jgi:hypothetical protein
MSNSTEMVKIAGSHSETGNVVTIYRQSATAHESARLMRECGYDVTIERGYIVNDHIDTGCFTLGPEPKINHRFLPPFHPTSSPDLCWKCGRGRTDHEAGPR